MGKLAIQGNIVQCFFHGRVRQPEPLLQKVDSQHGGDCKRWASRLASRRVRLNQSYQRSPRHDQIHFIEKLTLARSLGDQLKSGRGKAFLFHRQLTFVQVTRLTYADLPKLKLPQ